MSSIGDNDVMMTQLAAERNRAEWASFVAQPGPESMLYRGLYEVVEGFEHGTRTAWALNLLVTLCIKVTDSRDPSKLPCDSNVLRPALDEVLGMASAQVQRKGLHLLRCMLDSHEALRPLLQHLPRRLRLAPDPVRRRMQVVVDDAIPTAIRGTWAAELFTNILGHNATSGWRTSASAHQNLAMIHKFLRATGLLDCTSLAQFESTIRAKSRAEIERMCGDFTDKLCASSASARAYVGVFNMLFHKVFDVLQQPLAIPRKRRRMLTLEQLDRELSVAGSSVSGRRGKGVTFLSTEEVERLVQAAESKPQDSLIVGLLVTTGLRRRGLLNIKVSDVAKRHTEGSAIHNWQADRGGQTTEKGRKTRTFPIFPGVQVIMERWLNTPPDDGGRPLGPNPYLFPSHRTDNGQMSVTTLTRIFHRLCAMAGIDQNRAHPHILRHTCAHRLLDMGNTSRQIAAYLGHSNSTITERFYLQDSVENITRDMRLPWGQISSPDAADTAVSSNSVLNNKTVSPKQLVASTPKPCPPDEANRCKPPGKAPTVEQSGRKKTSSRDLLREVLALHAARRHEVTLADSPSSDIAVATLPIAAP